MKIPKGEIKFPKTEYMMSDLNDNTFFSNKPYKEDYKEDKHNEDSGLTFLYQGNYYRNESNKKRENDSYSNSPNKHDYEEDKNSDGENYISLDEIGNNDIDNYEEDKKESEIEIKSDNESEDNYNFHLNSALSLSISYDLTRNDNNNNNINEILVDDNKKIFRIVKVGRYRDLPHKKRRGRGKYKSKKNDIDWDNIQTPKEKHFHLDRKKKRIVFQRKHLKMIYSIANLPYPFNFTELYKLIDEHVGDKTVNNYGNKKSYHIIRINGKTIITTMKEKKNLLGRKVKPKQK